MVHRPAPVRAVLALMRGLQAVAVGTPRESTHITGTVHLDTTAFRGDLYKAQQAIFGRPMPLEEVMARSQTGDKKFAADNKKVQALMETYFKKRGKQR